MSHWKVVYYGFKIICVIATIALVCMWIKTYFLDTDIPTVETRSYFDTSKDVVPVISLCFQQTFDSIQLSSFATNISGSEYKYYLLGKHYDITVSYTHLTLPTKRIV